MSIAEAKLVGGEQRVAQDARLVEVHLAARVFGEVRAGGKDRGPCRVAGVQEAQVTVAGAEGVVPRREVDLGRG
jgi:hypothetical protein